ncbi:F0F1 ATP synthase subunit B [Phreatobacter sp.]|uniref:F0F1 ATP synthase subunit B n=1 Tax=Phreatobacter sp. TaxID=1966341 RepID=UPI003F6F2EF6
MAAPSTPGGFPPFQTETFASQIFWLAITFGALYWLLSKVVLPQIGGILEERSQRIARDLDEAQRMKSDAEAAQAAYEKALADARGNAQAIAAKEHARVSAETEATRKALEADLTTRLAAAEAEITASKAKAMTNVRGIAIDTVPAIVSQLVGKSPTAGDVEKAVDAALKG